jgi:hypothetical protein
VTFTASSVIAGLPKPCADGIDFYDDGKPFFHAPSERVYGAITEAL